MESVRTGVVGATGYLGTELVHRIWTHPTAEVAVATSTTHAGQRLEDVVPQLAGIDRTLVPPDPDTLSDLDVAFLATPSSAAGELVPDILDARTGTRIVDLSGAHRLADPDRHADHYPDVDRDPKAAEAAVYGLPEADAPRIAGADLVANPGCYPTGAVLATLPAVAEGWADAIHVSSVSGISGAGKTPTPRHHFPEANESVTAYGLPEHRHAPEIAQALHRYGGRNVPVTFVPHVAPMDRGIHTTAFLPGADVGPDTVRDLYAKTYADAPFVQVTETTPRTKTVRGTNRIDVSIHGTDTGLVVTAAHDNLVKGGAGQAVQNLNLMTGRDETSGLWLSGGAP